MAKRNDYDGICSVCGADVKANEGIKVYDRDSPHAGRRGYLILCVEHAPEQSLRPPSPPEASKLPSIYQDEGKYER
jgi:hypothetical protein